MSSIETNRVLCDSILITIRTRRADKKERAKQLLKTLSKRAVGWELKISERTLERWIAEYR